MDFDVILKNFLDSEKRIISFPSKRKMKTYVLFYLSTKFEKGKIYIEKEVNQILNEASCFEDAATLRRELYDNRFFGRNNGNLTYWLEEIQPVISDFKLD